MPTFDVDVGGATYEVDAPDERTAWRWANATHAKTAPAPTKPSTFDELKSGIATGFKYGGPIGAALGAIPASSKALEEAAYASGGKVTDVASKAGLSPSTAAALGFGTNVAMQAVPAVFGGWGSKAAEPLVQAGARTLMRSALKPARGDVLSGKADRAINTMFDEGLNVSEGGLNKAHDLIDGLNNQVRNVIGGSGAVVDANRAASRVGDVAQRALYSTQANADLAAIRAATQEFLDSPMVQLHGGRLPVQVAQDIKSGSYKVLGDKAYGLGLKPAAERDTHKAIIRGLKEEIERAHPEVGPLNAREGDLLNAANLIARREAVEGNKNILGLGVLSHSPGALALWMLDRWGAGKSVLGRAMNAGSERIPQAVGGTGVAAGQGILSNTGQEWP